MRKFTRIVAPALAALLGMAALTPTIAEAAPRHHDSRHDDRRHDDRRVHHRQPVHHARYAPPRHVKQYRSSHRGQQHHVVHHRYADRHHR